MSGFGRGRGAPRGGGGGKFRKSDPNEPRISSEVQIFVEGLPLDAKLPELVNFFSAAGKIKSDRMTRNPRVWLYSPSGFINSTNDKPNFLGFLYTALKRCQPFVPY